MRLGFRGQGVSAVAPRIPPQVGDCAVLLCPQGDGLCWRKWGWRLQAAAAEPGESPLGWPQDRAAHPDGPEVALVPLSHRNSDSLPVLQAPSSCAGQGAAALAVRSASRPSRSCSSWCCRHCPGVRLMG